MDAGEDDVPEQNTSDLQLLKHALDTLEDVFFVFTPNGEILEWNRQLTEETGFTDEEIEEMQPVDFVPPEDEELVRRHIERVFEEGHTRVEARLQTKEGELVPYEFAGSLLTQNGETLICGTGRNITQRKRAEKKKRTSEERYRRLFEDAQEGIMVTTPEGDIVDANPAAERILGYSKKELRHMKAADLYVDPDERKGVAAELSADGVIQKRPIHLRRSDGTEIVCEVSGTFRQEEEEPSRWIGFFRDVTERTRAERALKESEEKFRKLAEGALVGITLIQDGAFVYVNPEMARITGYTQEELVGASPRLPTHPDDWPLVKEKIEKRLEGEADEVHYETRIHRKDGEIRHVKVAGSRITYRDEPAVIATAQDVTEQRRLQQEILDVQEEERKRLGQELHDGVASQLTGVMAKLNVLSEKIEAEDVADDLREIRDIVEESAGDVRRLSRGLNPTGLLEGDLFSALEGLAETIDGGRFEPERSGEAPSSSTTALPLDEEEATHLYRITQEAVSNARRHGDADEIVIHLQREDGVLVLGVEDDGKGFEPEELRKEGLGLRSMQHRAELLGADLTIESNPNQGTLIRCRLSV